MNEEKPGTEQGKPVEKGGARPGEAAQRSPRPADRRRLLRWGVVGIAVLVGLIAWLTTRGGDDESESAPVEAGAPRIVTVAELREAAATLGQPIYWAGPEAGKELELKELGEGGVQVVYVPEGTEPGQEPAKALTIGSYTLPDPAGALEAVAKRPGEIVRQASDGREVVTSEESPTNVYFVSPDNSVQVEVYDPSAKRAMNLALSGKVQPAG